MAYELKWLTVEELIKALKQTDQDRSVVVAASCCPDVHLFELQEDNDPEWGQVLVINARN